MSVWISPIIAIDATVVRVEVRRSALADTTVIRRMPGPPGYVWKYVLSNAFDNDPDDLNGWGPR